MVDIAILQMLEPVRGLSVQRLEDLARHCALETHPLGTDVFATPASASQLVYLIEGELRVVFDDGGSSLLVGGCESANWPFGYGAMLPVRSKAITEVRVLRIDFDLLDLMMTWDGVIGDSPAAAEAGEPAGRGAGVSVADATRFAWLPVANIPEFIKQLERVPCRSGETIIREGDPGDFFYIVESGRCAVSRAVGGVQMELAELKSGDCFGEAALLTGEARNATVRMKTDGVLFRMGQAQFEALMRRPLLHDIDWKDAQAKLAGGMARWIDVRYPAEFSEDGFEDALNIPLNEIRLAFGLLDRDVEYIIYCQSGRRSSAAAFLLSQQGFRSYWLAGGLAAIPPEAGHHRRLG